MQKAGIRRNGPPLRAVLFDFDNTLQDLDTAFNVASREVLGPVCLEAGVDPPCMLDAMGAVWPGLWARFLAGELAEAELYSRWIRLAFAKVGPKISEERARALADAYHPCFEQSLVLYPDALPAIEALGRACPDIRLAIVTNGPGARQRRRIAALGLDAWLGICVVSEEVGFPKPDPRPFEAALAGLGVAASEAVMIGDDPVGDVAGAKGVHMRAVWLNRSGRAWPVDVPDVADAEARTLMEAVGLVLASTARTLKR